MVGKGTTHQRTGNGSNAIHSSNKTGVYRAFDEGYRVCDNDQATGKYTSRSNTGYRPTNDQGDRVGRSTADEGADLKYANGREEDPFDAEKGVEFAEEQLECACRQ